MSRPLAVFVHGWAFRPAVFDALAAALAPTHRVLVPDLAALYDGDAASLARGVADLVAREGGDALSITLAGWSMGYLVAAQVAAACDVKTLSKITSMLGLAALPCLGSLHGIPRATVDGMLAGIPGDPARVLRKFRQWAWYPDRQSRAADEAFDPAYLAATLRFLVDTDVAAIPLPCQPRFLLAERDAVLPVAAREDYPGLDITVVPGVGHAGILGSDEVKRAIVGG